MNKKIEKLKCLECRKNELPTDNDGSHVLCEDCKDKYFPGWRTAPQERCSTAGEALAPEPEYVKNDYGNTSEVVWHRVNSINHKLPTEAPEPESTCRGGVCTTVRVANAFGNVMINPPGEVRREYCEKHQPKAPEPETPKTEYVKNDYGNTSEVVWHRVNSINHKLPTEAPNVAPNLQHTDKGVWTIGMARRAEKLCSELRSPEGAQLRDTMEEAYEDEIKRLKARMREALTFEYSELTTKWKAEVKQMLGLPLEDYEREALLSDDNNGKNK